MYYGRNPGVFPLRAQLEGTRAPPSQCTSQPDSANSLVTPGGGMKRSLNFRVSIKLPSIELVITP